MSVSPEFERVRDTIEKYGIVTGPGPQRTTKHRVAVLQAIQAAWDEHPEYRLCQLLSNAFGAGPQDLFYVEDDRLVAALSGVNITHAEEEQ